MIHHYNNARKRTYSPYKKAAFTLAEGATHVALSDNQRRYAFTHAEAHTHVAHSDNTRRAAFTLAEVLITLGIIGIVAAMTIPAVFTNYRKTQVSTQLKAAQSILTQMMTMASVDYGDPVTWDFSKVSDIEFGQSLTSSDIVVPLVEKYFLPYLKNIQNNGYTTLGDAGYSIYKNPDGKPDSNCLYSLAVSAYVIEFANGMTIFVTLNSSQTTMKYTNVLLYIDINGKKGPNVFGRDTFLAQINSSTGKFEWYGSTSNINSAIRNCKNRAIFCGALIQMEGFQITDNYPFRI